MSDKATMLEETVEAFADLRAMLDGLTEEQASPSGSACWACGIW